MAAIALPISELEPVRIEAEKAQAETECVVVCSKEERPDKGTVWHIAWKTFALRRRFSQLTIRQAKLITNLVKTNFTNGSPEQLEALATSIDELVSDEREILASANSLGSEIRAWWSTSLIALADQVEYLDSISQSLHVAADPEASLLMGLAVQQMAAD